MTEVAMQQSIRPPQSHNASTVKNVNIMIRLLGDLRRILKCQKSLSTSSQKLNHSTEFFPNTTQNLSRQPKTPSAFSSSISGTIHHRVMSCRRRTAVKRTETETSSVKNSVLTTTAPDRRRSLFAKFRTQFLGREPARPLARKWSTFTT